MALSVTPLYAALLGFLLVYLSIRVIRLRRRLKVAIGGGGEAVIERAARVQANFSEYVPMALILLLLAEIQGGSPLVLHAIGLALSWSGGPPMPSGLARPRRTIAGAHSA